MKNSNEIGINIFRDNEKIAIVKNFDLLRLFLEGIGGHEWYSVGSMARGERKIINGHELMYDFNFDETLFPSEFNTTNNDTLRESIEKEPVAAMIINAMKYCDNEQRLQLIKALQERTEANEKLAIDEIIEEIYTNELQNTSGRETPDEMFKKGIRAAIEKLNKIINAQ